MKTRHSKNAVKELECILERMDRVAHLCGAMGRPELAGGLEGPASEVKELLEYLKYQATGSKSMGC